MSEKIEAHSGISRQHRRQHDSGSTGTIATAAFSSKVINNRVFVGNIPSNLAERDLAMLFNRFGKIRDVKIIPEYSRNKSYGFVTFYSETDARRALHASAQPNSVMWGDRKLNIAPAVRRNCHYNSASSSANGYYQTRSTNSSFYANPLHVSTPALFHGTTDLHQQQQQPIVDPMTVTVDASNNAMYPATVICNLPHQYGLSPCHQYSAASSGHYYLTPGYQPYLQPGMPTNPQMQHYGSYPTPYGGMDNYRSTAASQSMQNQQVCITPMTPPPSSNSRDNSTVTDGQSDGEGGSCNSPSDSNSSQQGNEKSSNDDTPTNESSGEAVQHQLSSGVDQSYPLHAAIVCCAHHSCMMSPVSPVPHLASQPSASMARSCMSLHHPGAAYYAPNTPVIYGSPVVYNTSNRRASHSSSPATRLQRWNSLDANLGGHHHPQMGLWSNETGWSRPSLLDDSYGSETGLYPPPRAYDRLRPAFSCQSHHAGMFSPFCRSYDYNIWGQAQQHALSQQVMEQSEYSNSQPALMTTPSSLSLNHLNLNETSTDQSQIQQQAKK